MKKYFKAINEKIPLPVFFPDATRAVVKTIDSIDIEQTKTPGILVNTYHLYQDLGQAILKKHQGIRNFMSWQRAIISDSGGFQVMSIVKNKNQGKITDKGIVLRQSKKKIIFSPEESIKFQMLLKPDMLVALDDFTPPNTSYKQALQTVERTILWARRSKAEFEKQCKEKKIKSKQRPYLLGVIQGGEYLDLREYCARELLKIGFDGFGYGGWPIKQNGGFNWEVAKTIAKVTPKNYFLYGLGIGKPEEILGCSKLGYNIFDCVLPTRDARHQRLYVWQADSVKNINLDKPKFYSFFTPGKQKYLNDTKPVSKACDCLLCRQYSRAYLAHLFKIKDPTALRLSTIHNLRFYSLLMEKIRENNKLKNQLLSGTEKDKDNPGQLLQEKAF